MKIIKCLVIAVVLIIIGSVCIVSAKPSRKNEQGKSDEKKLDALLKIKSRLIEIKGYDPSQWPPGIVELLYSHELIR